MSLLTSNIPAEKPCTICRYPTWTKTGAAEDEEYEELMCENFEELCLSATSGCLGCALLAKAWKYGTPASDERAEERITFNRFGSPTSLYVHLFKHPHGVLNIDIFTVGDTPRFKHIRPAALIPSSTGLEENLSTIQKWLRACEECHRTCSVPNTDIPLRLLDLETGTPDSICLVELKLLELSSGNGKEHDATLDFRYACLSHCWGKTKFKHLTKETTLASNLEGIPIIDLPETFKDAVTICRALGIRYLWIDSLCIVQDDQADWRFHVDKMAQIYRNAYITLAAGASVDDAGGFFKQPASQFSVPTPFKLSDKETEYEMFFRKCLPHPDEH